MAGESGSGFVVLNAWHAALVASVTSHFRRLEWKQLDDVRQRFSWYRQLRGGGKGEEESGLRGEQGEIRLALRSTRIVFCADWAEVSGVGVDVSLGSEVFMTDLEATKP